MIHYDMHSHILPRMDDGSSSAELSEKLLKILLSQKVSKVCVTPHYYSHREPIDEFVERRDKCLEKLKPVIPGGVEICVGAEVYVTEILMNNRDLSPLCYGGGSFVLLEFPYDFTFSGSQFDFLVRIINNYRVRPVLAHIERYPCLMKSTRTMENLAGAGVLFQANVSSFLDFRSRRKLLYYAKKGFVNLLGSDCHNLSRNNPESFAPACDLIKNKLGERYLRRMNTCAEKIFTEKGSLV